MTQYLIIYLLLGLVFGSFLNVVILRMKTAESFLTGYSKCLSCQKRLRWYDLIPVISFMILYGRCRNCQDKISWQYPLVELATSLLFVISFLLYGAGWQSALSALFLTVFLGLAVFDFKEMAVPESLSWVLLGIALVGKVILNYQESSFIILGGVISGGLIALLVYGSRGKWMGDGDIKVAAALGLFLGFPLAVFGIFASFIVGALTGSVMLATRLKKGKDQLPFTPFLMTGLLLSMIVGQQIVDWYLGKFIF